MDMGIKKPEYARAIVSVRAHVVYRGVDCHVLVRDPLLGANFGYMWLGGYFFPSGNLEASAEDIVFRESGISLKSGSMHLKTIVYSRTKQHGFWVGNHSFSAEAVPVDMWSTPQNPDYQVILVSTESLKKGTPQLVAVIHPGKWQHGSEHVPWGTNDGPYLAGVSYFEHQAAARKKDYFPDIPIVQVPFAGKSSMKFGYGMNISNVILPHHFKGKFGFVCIKNNDAPDLYGFLGGKIESLDTLVSRNIDALSCMAAEAEEEIGIPLQGLSIVGCALTPLDKVLRKDHGLVFETNTPGRCNSVLTISILARPRNPEQLTAAIQHPEQFIPVGEREKILGIYFLPVDEYQDLLLHGEMRTVDMIPLAQQHFSSVPSERPSLESISIIPPTKFRSGESGELEVALF